MLDFRGDTIYVGDTLQRIGGLGNVGKVVENELCDSLCILMIADGTGIVRILTPEIIEREKLVRVTVQTADTKYDAEFEKILAKDYSREFDDKRKRAIITSYYKYGNAYKHYPELAQAHKCIEERLELYRKTHNTEYLVDVANFAMLEFLYPAFEDAKYEPQDSDASPGLAGGISYKQLMEEMEND